MAALNANVISISQALQAELAKSEPQSLVSIIDHLEALFESLEGLEDEAQRAECEADIFRYIEKETKKVDSIASYLRHCKSQQQFAADEMKRLQTRKRSFESRQQRLESYVMRIMEASAKTRLEGKINTFSLRNSPASVEVIDQSQVPQQFIRIVVSETVDKTAAKEVMKTGEQVPGLALVTDHKHLVTK